MFRVITDIPPPGKISIGQRREGPKYPFQSMPVGGSFFVPLQDPRPRMAASQFKRRNPGWDYVTKKEAGGYRLWRTA